MVIVFPDRDIEMFVPAESVTAGPVAPLRDVMPEVPPELAVVCTVPSGKTKPPDVLWTLPTTTSRWAGVSVPMPTLPAL
jgi:hypothetical protein